MLHQQDRHALGSNLGDEMIDLLRLDGVAAGGRFIEQQRTGFQRQRAGDLQALQRAVGERARLLFGGPAETDPVEQGPRTFLRRPAATTRGRQGKEIGKDRTALMQMMADNGVFEHAHRLEYLQILKGARQAAAGEQVR